MRSKKEELIKTFVAATQKDMAVNSIIQRCRSVYIYMHIH